MHDVSLNGDVGSCDLFCQTKRVFSFPTLNQTSLSFVSSNEVASVRGCRTMLRPWRVQAQTSKLNLILRHTPSEAMPSGTGLLVNISNFYLQVRSIRGF